jgi:hypothetical protein
MWLPMHRRPSFAYTQGNKRRRANYTNPYQLLNTPRTEKLNLENKIFHGLEVGHSAMQGYRVHMEDEHIIQDMSLDKHVLVAIMDGNNLSILQLLR